MKYILAGTDREGSNTLKVSEIIKEFYKSEGEEVEIIDLREVKKSLETGPHYGKNQPDFILHYTEKVLHAEGLIVVVPEYNGSMPGILKYFIDHLKFPESFEYRPVCFVGLGGIFGGLRPVEHLQQVFGYRNAFIYPERVFLINIWNQLKENRIQDPLMSQLLIKQVRGFRRFVDALNKAGIDANHFIAQKTENV